MLKRLKVIAVPYGIAYALAWVITIWFMGSGDIIRGNAACIVADDSILPIWLCPGDTVLGTLVFAVNTALAVTMWAPVFVAAALVNTQAVPLALAYVVGHLTGLIAISYVIGRTVRTILITPFLAR
ncbi:MAG: hypothetical protein AAF638_02410 [Pseudomonadota bacterium]